MAKINVNKIDAARRQTDQAIRLLFTKGDPVAVQTLAAAAFRILRDLSEKHGEGRWWSHFKTMIKPGMENEFWQAINAPANFFKHADKDFDDVLDNVDETFNDFMLLFCCELYNDLGDQPTIAMKIHYSLMVAFHPDILQSEVVKDLISSDYFEDLRGMTRDEWLELADKVLRKKIQEQENSGPFN